MSVIQVNPKQDRTRRIRRALGKSVHGALKCFEDDVGGYALVVWNQRGEPYSSFWQGGCIGRGLVPAYVHDALQRHVTVQMVQENVVEESVDDE
jgi:hypothetical protein